MCMDEYIYTFWLSVTFFKLLALIEILVEVLSEKMGHQTEFIFSFYFTTNYFPLVGYHVDSHSVKNLPSYSAIPRHVILSSAEPIPEIKIQELVPRLAVFILLTSYVKLRIHCQVVHIFCGNSGLHLTCHPSIYI